MQQFILTVTRIVSDRQTLGVHDIEFWKSVTVSSYVY